MRAARIVLAALLIPGAAGAASVDATLDLDQVGLNMSLASEPNGDLHLVWRAGQGPDPAQYGQIRYLHYTAADEVWHFPSLLVLEESGTTRVRVSPDIDTNQPRVAVDPTAPGRALILFAGDFRRQLQPTLVRIEPTQDGQGRLADTIRLGSPRKEIRGVDLVVAADGTLFACEVWTNAEAGGDPNQNGIYCFRGPAGGSSFVRERATLRQGAGEGLSAVAGSSGPARVAGTFGSDRRNAVYSRRDGLASGLWSPGPVLFDLPHAAGKLRLTPPLAGRERLYAFSSIQAESNELFFFELADGVPVTGPLRLQRYVYLGPALFPSQGGDRFSSEDLSAARSASGREAVAYGIDGTVFLHGVPPVPGNDLGLVLSVPAGGAWPAEFQDGLDTDGTCLCGAPNCPGSPPDCDPEPAGCDVFCDGLNDLIAGTKSLDQVRLERGSFPYMGQGTEGREVIAFDAAETLAAAFSGESLWVAYYDGIAGNARVSRIRFEPPVPELGPAALGLLLLLGGPFALGRRRRGRVGVAAVALACLASGCGGSDNEGGDGGGGLRFEGPELALGRGGLLPDVASTSAGGLHLCYRGDPARGDNGVYHQFYRASSRSWTAAVRLDDATHSLSRSLEFGSPRVASDPAGGATVVWAEFPDPGHSVWARDIGSDGVPAPGFQLVHSERGLAVEQHDLAIDAGGAAHLVFGLIGQGQDGIHHKTRPAGGAWESGRQRVFSGGRKHPVVEAFGGAAGAPLLWAAWRFRDLEYASFDGRLWSAATRIVPPQRLSIGDPALAIRPDGRPTIGTSPYETGAVNRSAYVHQAGAAEPLLQIDVTTHSSTGVVDVAVSASGRSLVVWDRFVLGLKPGLGIISQVESLDPSRDRVVNKQRVCYKLSDEAGRFPTIPDADNSNALALPIEGDLPGEQGYAGLEIRGDTVDLVYLEARGSAVPQLFHRRAQMP